MDMRLSKSFARTLQKYSIIIANSVADIKMCLDRNESGLRLNRGISLSFVEIESCYNNKLNINVLVHC